MPDPTLVADLLQKLQILRALPKEEKTAFYDDSIAPALAECARAVEAEPSGANIAQWLAVQSAALGFAVEGITEVTQTLREGQPRQFEEALATLSPDSRTRLDWLTRELDNQENLPADVIARETARGEQARAAETEVADDLETAPVGVLGGYQQQSTFRSTRGFTASHGVFALFDSNGQRLGQWTANSGGGARDYRTTNGPVPPGIYLVSNYRANRSTDGMVLHGVGFSFDLDETDGTQVYGRSLFRIHPDGNSPGTNGCIGILEERDELRRCENTIARLLRDQGGQFKIRVRY
jgi:hypothetical protein